MIKEKYKSQLITGVLATIIGTLILTTIIKAFGLLPDWLLGTKIFVLIFVFFKGVFWTGCASTIFFLSFVIPLWMLGGFKISEDIKEGFILLIAIIILISIMGGWVNVAYYIDVGSSLGL